MSILTGILITAGILNVGADIIDDIYLKKHDWKGQHHLLSRKIDVVPKDKIKGKIEKYKHKDFIKLQVCYQHDNEAAIKVKAYEELLEEE